MALFDDDERDSNATSDNDHDELMEDADDGVGEVDAEEDNQEDEEDEEGDDDDDDIESTSRKSQLTRSETGPINSHESVANGDGPTSHPRPSRTSASPRSRSASIAQQSLYPTIRLEALTAKTYDIVPTIAAPQSTSINCIACTPDMRYWFTGGSDCYVRKYDGIASVNGKQMLTVAQRHPFVESVVKAGSLMSYWENEEPRVKNVGDEPNLSPVYSLAVHKDALWLLSGLDSGTINLQSVRHDEGKRIACLEGHTKTVSVLTLGTDEKSVLSGSWDNDIIDWDLNTGQRRQDFRGNGGQISAIQIRPESSLPVPEELGDVPVTNGTYASNNGDKPRNGSLSNGTTDHDAKTSAAIEDVPASPTEADSLFGGGDGDADSLFGDNDAGNGGEDDDDFSKALRQDYQEQSEQNGESLATSDAVDFFPAIDDMDGDKAPATAATAATAAATGDTVSTPAATSPKTTTPPTNGLPHATDETTPAERATTPQTQDPQQTSNSTFLAAAFDGTLLVWDRRQPVPVARIPSRTGGPWCMDACWSPDGNYIYAGRRNNTVEEFSLHKGLKSAERTFKFPNGSGPVSAVRAMPNGRHLVCASYDILRLYDLREEKTKHSTVPFTIIPGPPRAGVISALHVDPTCKYMLSAAGNRGWEGSSTECLIGYEICAL